MMTRAEAIEKFTVESDLDDLAPAIIDGLEALGLIKLEAPKSPLSRALGVLENGEWHNERELETLLWAVGVKVVEATK